jgi:hypothetical protein
MENLMPTFGQTMLQLLFNLIVLVLPLAFFTGIAVRLALAHWSKSERVKDEAASYRRLVKGRKAQKAKPVEEELSYLEE